MLISIQLAGRRAQTGKTLQEVADLTDMAPSNLSKILSGKTEARTSTLEAVADALDATWVLVPKHLMPEVERLLSGKAIGPDEAKSTVDQIFGSGAHE